MVGPARNSNRTRRRRASALVVALATVVAFAACAASAPAAKAPTEFYGVSLGSPTDRTDALQMQNSKVSTMRMLFSWPAIQPKRGTYRWPDGMVAQLAQHGIRVLPYLGGSPKWATGSSDVRTPPLKGKAKRAWTTFVKAAVERYKPGGEFWRAHPSLPAKPIEQWQIWNEPNLKKEWPPKASPKQYAKLVKVTEPVIARADGGAKVLLAGLSGSSRADVASPLFLKKLYRQRGIKGLFDGVALHPYAATIPSLKKKIKQARKAMKKGHDKSTSLWLTEIGYGSAPKDKFGMNQGTAQGQATMLRKSFELILKSRKKWKVAQLDWYDWRDPANPPARAWCSFCPHAGLVNPDRSPKPAFWEFREFTGAPRPSPDSGGLLGDLLDDLPIP